MKTCSDHHYNSAGICGSCGHRLGTPGAPSPRTYREQEASPDLAAQVGRVVKQQAAAIDEMCARMFSQPGWPCGILVRSSMNYATNSFVTEVSLSPEAPFGEIHYAPMKIERVLP